MAKRAIPFLRYIFIIGFVTISFLFSPKPHSQQEYCGTFYNMGTCMGFVINCDSYEYVRVSTDISRLFEPRSLRQSRPLFILIGSLTGKALFPILRVFHFNIYEAHYAGFLLLNFIFLLFSVFLLDRIMCRNTALNAAERSAFLVLLLSNVVTKTFFWTAHQQMFTFLTPLLCISVMQWMAEDRNLPAVYICLLSFLCGLGLLVYGNFILLAICIFTMMVYCRYSVNVILGSVLLTGLPVVIWLLILQYKGVAFYNHEMAHYHQFVWVRETLSVSLPAFIGAAISNWRLFTATFGAIMIFFIALISIAAYRVFIRRGMIAHRPLIAICSFLIALSFVFLYFMGFYQERLTYMLISPVVVLIALFYSESFRHRGWQGSIILILLVAAWHLYAVTRYGPFS